jgi:sRNA-binding regulator protein Hfq
VHEKHTPLLATNDFYIEEMKEAGYKKSTEYVFSVDDEITVFFASGKNVSGIVQDESKYWVLLQSKKLQITVLKGSYSYFKHGVYESKPYLYVANKRLKKTLRKDK